MGCCGLMTVSALFSSTDLYSSEMKIFREKICQVTAFGGTFRGTNFKRERRLWAFYTNLLGDKKHAPFYSAWFLRVGSAGPATPLRSSVQVIEGGAERTHIKKYISCLVWARIIPNANKLQRASVVVILSVTFATTTLGFLMQPSWHKDILMSVV